MQASKQGLVELKIVSLTFASNRFSKLFMTHLQAEFSKEADVKVKTLIDDQVRMIIGPPLSRRPLLIEVNFSLKAIWNT